MRSRRRRSVRLRLHDYRGGLYFVTVCTWGRRPLFGEVMDGAMRRSTLGQLAHGEWLRTDAVRPDVVLDAFVVMPDHVHLLFGIVPGGDDTTRHAGDDPTNRAVGATRRVAPTDGPVAPTDDPRQPCGPLPRSAGAVVGQYKSIVTKRIWAAHGRETGRVWQRGFHDRVVRTDREADALRRYIAENPSRWAPDADREDGHRL